MRRNPFVYYGKKALVFFLLREYNFQLILEIQIYQIF